MITVNESKKSALVSESRQAVKPDGILLTGYLLLAGSVMLYCVAPFIGHPIIDRDGFVLFFVHYGLAFAYFIVLLSVRSYGVRKSWRLKNIDRTVVLLQIFLVAAYALNRSLPVFEDSVAWLCIYLIVSAGIMLSYRYFNHLPRAVNKVQHFLLGMSLVLYVYMVQYIGPIYYPALFGILILGIGLLAFVPIFLSLAAAALTFHAHMENRVSSRWILAGAATSLTFVALFIIEWNAQLRTIERLGNQPVIYADTKLPLWVKIGQSLKVDWITKRILESDIAYATPDHLRDEYGFLLTRSFGDIVRKHDPLVYLANLSRGLSLSRDDRDAILQGAMDPQHRRPVSLPYGGNLTTSYVVTDVDIYPDLRLAYTEQYINIRNNAGEQGRDTEEEAIYTFQLPEGSVVTALSSWANGQEEKATPTPKTAAAYTAINAWETYDPSVTYWQEDNTVLVRVFPCTKDEERKFKIGITSPLPEEDSRVVYRTATFRGANARDARGTYRIRFTGGPTDVSLPSGFDTDKKGDYLVEGEYNPDFEISWKALPPPSNQYTFNNTTYSLLRYRPDFRALHLSYLFLDIDNTWRAEEVDAAYSVLAKCNVYAFAENEFVRLDENNWYDVTSKLRKRNFSLFPFHHIADTEHSLVITKGRSSSPDLCDIKESAFAESVRRYFAANKKVNVFNLTGGTSTYIRSLHALRAFNYATGNVDTLSEMLEHNQFPVSIEDEHHIVLYDAGLVLETRPVSSNLKENTAPDHLAQLFTYNNIKRQVSKKLADDCE